MSLVIIGVISDINDIKGVSIEINDFKGDFVMLLLQQHWFCEVTDEIKGDCMTSLMTSQNQLCDVPLNRQLIPLVIKGVISDISDMKGECVMFL